MFPVSEQKKGGKPKMELHITLKAARANADMTITQAAEVANVSRNTIINWEKGRRTPRADKLNTLCNAYGISIDNIFLPCEFAESELPYLRRDA